MIILNNCTTPSDHTKSFEPFGMLANGGAANATQVGGVKDKHPTNRANRVNPLAGNCNVAHIARFATLPPPYLKARPCALTTQPPSTSKPCIPMEVQPPSHL